MAIRSEHLYKHVEIVIISKLEEFTHYGYKGITKEQLWNYCLDKKWRKKDVEQLHLYEVVATIYEVEASHIISYEQVNEFRYTQTTDLSKEELYFLLQAPVKTEGIDV